MLWSIATNMMIVLLQNILYLIKLTLFLIRIVQTWKMQLLTFLTETKPKTYFRKEEGIPTYQFLRSSPNYPCLKADFVMYLLFAPLSFCICKVLKKWQLPVMFVWSEFLGWVSNQLTWEIFYSFAAKQWIFLMKLHWLCL